MLQMQRGTTQKNPEQQQQQQQEALSRPPAAYPAPPRWPGESSSAPSRPPRPLFAVRLGRLEGLQVVGGGRDAYLYVRVRFGGREHTTPFATVPAASPSLQQLSPLRASPNVSPPPSARFYQSGGPSPSWPSLESTAFFWWDGRGAMPDAEFIVCARAAAAVDAQRQAWQARAAELAALLVDSDEDDGRRTNRRGGPGEDEETASGSSSSSSSTSYGSRSDGGLGFTSEQTRPLRDGEAAAWPMTRSEKKAQHRAHRRHAARSQPSPPRLRYPPPSGGTAVQRRRGQGRRRRDGASDEDPLARQPVQPAATDLVVGYSRVRLDPSMLDADSRALLARPSTSAGARAGPRSSPTHSRQPTTTPPRATAFRGPTHRLQSDSHMGMASGLDSSTAAAGADAPSVGLTTVRLGVRGAQDAALLRRFGTLGTLRFALHATPVAGAQRGKAAAGLAQQHGRRCGDDASTAAVSCSNNGGADYDEEEEDGETAIARAVRRAAGGHVSVEGYINAEEARLRAVLDRVTAHRALDRAMQRFFGSPQTTPEAALLQTSVLAGTGAGGEGATEGLAAVPCLPWAAVVEGAVHRCAIVQATFHPLDPILDLRDVRSYLAARKEQELEQAVRHLEILRRVRQLHPTSRATWWAAKRRKLARRARREHEGRLLRELPSGSGQRMRAQQQQQHEPRQCVEVSSTSGIEVEDALLADGDTVVSVDTLLEHRGARLGRLLWSSYTAVALHVRSADSTRALDSADPAGEEAGIPVRGTGSNSSGGDDGGQWPFSRPTARPDDPGRHGAAPVRAEASGVAQREWPCTPFTRSLRGADPAQAVLWRTQQLRKSRYARCLARWVTALTHPRLLAVLEGAGADQSPDHADEESREGADAGLWRARRNSSFAPSWRTHASSTRMSSNMDDASGGSDSSHRRSVDGESGGSTAAPQRDASDARGRLVGAGAEGPSAASVSTEPPDAMAQTLEAADGPGAHVHDLTTPTVATASAAGGLPVPQSSALHAASRSPAAGPGGAHDTAAGNLARDALGWPMPQAPADANGFHWDRLDIELADEADLLCLRVAVRVSQAPMPPLSVALPRPPPAGAATMTATGSHSPTTSFTSVPSALVTPVQEGKRRSAEARESAADEHEQQKPVPLTLPTNLMAAAVTATDEEARGRADAAAQAPKGHGATAEGLALPGTQSASVVPPALPPLSAYTAYPTEDLCVCFVEGDAVVRQLSLVTAAPRSDEMGRPSGACVMQGEVRMVPLFFPCYAAGPARPRETWTLEDQQMAVQNDPRGTLCGWLRLVVRLAPSFSVERLTQAAPARRGQQQQRQEEEEAWLGLCGADGRACCADGGIGRDGGARSRYGATGAFIAQPSPTVAALNHTRTPHTEFADNRDAAARQPVAARATEGGAGTPSPFHSSVLDHIVRQSGAESQSPAHPATATAATALALAMPTSTSTRPPPGPLSAGTHAATSADLVREDGRPAAELRGHSHPAPSTALPSAPNTAGHAAPRAAAEDNAALFASLPVAPRGGFVVRVDHAVTTPLSVAPGCGAGAAGSHSAVTAAGPCALVVGGVYHAVLSFPAVAPPSAAHGADAPSRTAAAAFPAVVLHRKRSRTAVPGLAEADSGTSGPPPPRSLAISEGPLMTPQERRRLRRREFRQQQQLLRGGAVPVASLAAPRSPSPPASVPMSADARRRLREPSSVSARWADGTYVVEACGPYAGVPLRVDLVEEPVGAGGGASQSAGSGTAAGVVGAGTASHSPRPAASTLAGDSPSSRLIGTLFLHYDALPFLGHHRFALAPFTGTTLTLTWSISPELQQRCVWQRLRLLHRESLVRFAVSDEGVAWVFDGVRRCGLESSATAPVHSTQSTFSAGHHTRAVTVAAAAAAAAAAGGADPRNAVTAVSQPPAGHAPHPAEHTSNEVPQSALVSAPLAAPSAVRPAAGNSSKPERHVYVNADEPRTSSRRRAPSSSVQRSGNADDEWPKGSPGGEMQLPRPQAQRPERLRSVPLPLPSPPGSTSDMPTSAQASALPWNDEEGLVGDARREAWMGGAAPDEGMPAGAGAPPRGLSAGGPLEEGGRAHAALPRDWEAHAHPSTPWPELSLARQPQPTAAVVSSGSLSSTSSATRHDGWRKGSVDCDVSPRERLPVRLARQRRHHRRRPVETRYRIARGGGEAEVTSGTTYAGVARAMPSLRLRLTVLSLQNLRLPGPWGSRGAGAGAPASAGAGSSSFTFTPYVVVLYEGAAHDNYSLALPSVTACADAAVGRRNNTLVYFTVELEVPARLTVQPLHTVDVEVRDVVTRQLFGVAHVHLRLPREAREPGDPEGEEDDDVAARARRGLRSRRPDGATVDVVHSDWDSGSVGSGGGAEDGAQLGETATHVIPLYRHTGMDDAWHAAGAQQGGEPVRGRWGSGQRRDSTAALPPPSSDTTDEGAPVVGEVTVLATVLPRPSPSAALLRQPMCMRMTVLGARALVCAAELCTAGIDTVAASWPQRGGALPSSGWVPDTYVIATVRQCTPGGGEGVAAGSWSGADSRHPLHGPHPEWYEADRESSVLGSRPSDAWRTREYRSSTVRHRRSPFWYLELPPLHCASPMDVYVFTVYAAEVDGFDACLGESSVTAGWLMARSRAGAALGCVGDCDVEFSAAPQTVQLPLGKRGVATEAVDERHGSGDDGLGSIVLEWSVSPACEPGLAACPGARAAMAPPGNHAVMHETAPAPSAVVLELRVDAATALALEIPPACMSAARPGSGAPGELLNSLSVVAAVAVDDGAYGGTVEPGNGSSSGPFSVMQYRVPLNAGPHTEGAMTSSAASFLQLVGGALQVGTAVAVSCSAGSALSRVTPSHLEEVDGKSGLQGGAGAPRLPCTRVSVDAVFGATTLTVQLPLVGGAPPVRVGLWLRSPASSPSVCTAGEAVHRSFAPAVAALRPTDTFIGEAVLHVESVPQCTSALQDPSSVTLLLRPRRDPRHRPDDVRRANAFPSGLGTLVCRAAVYTVATYDARRRHLAQRAGWRAELVLAVEDATDFEACGVFAVEVRCGGGTARRSHVVCDRNPRFHETFAFAVFAPTEVVEVRLLEWPEGGGRAAEAERRQGRGGGGPRVTATAAFGVEVGGRADGPRVAAGESGDRTARAAGTTPSTVHTSWITLRPTAAAVGEGAWLSAGRARGQPGFVSAAGTAPKLLLRWRMRVCERATPHADDDAAGVSSRVFLSPAAPQQVAVKATDHSSTSHTSVPPPTTAVPPPSLRGGQRSDAGDVLQSSSGVTSSPVNLRRPPVSATMSPTASPPPPPLPPLTAAQLAAPLVLNVVWLSGELVSFMGTSSSTAEEVLAFCEARLARSAGTVEALGAWDGPYGGFTASTQQAPVPRGANLALRPLVPVSEFSGSTAGDAAARVLPARQPLLRYVRNGDYVQVVHGSSTRDVDGGVGSSAPQGAREPARRGEGGREVLHSRDTKDVPLSNELTAATTTPTRTLQAPAAYLAPNKTDCVVVAATLPTAPLQLSRRYATAVQQQRRLTWLTSRSALANANAAVVERFATYARRELLAAPAAQEDAGHEDDGGRPALLPPDSVDCPLADRKCEAPLAGRGGARHPPVSGHTRGPAETRDGRASRCVVITFLFRDVVDTLVQSVYAHAAAVQGFCRPVRAPVPSQFHVRERVFAVDTAQGSPFHAAPPPASQPRPAPPFSKDTPDTATTLVEAAEVCVQGTASCLFALLRHVERTCGCCNDAPQTGTAHEVHSPASPLAASPATLVVVEEVVGYVPCMRRGLMHLAINAWEAQQVWWRCAEPWEGGSSRGSDEAAEPASGGPVAFLVLADPEAEHGEGGGAIAERPGLYYMDERADSAPA